MNKRLFAYLKQSKVFTGGHKTLREYLTEHEEKRIMKDRARNVIKKVKVK